MSTLKNDLVRFGEVLRPTVFSRSMTSTLCIVTYSDKVNFQIKKKKITR